MSDQILKIKDFTNKKKCKCGAVAVWCYMPSSDDDENPYFCEECVWRGCSCEWNYVSEFGPPPSDKRWKWIIIKKGDTQYDEEIKEGEVWVHVDEQSREYPCCEFMYEEEGWDKK